MRTVTRLTRLGQWIYETCCKGREMKTPASSMDITEIARQEPKVYIGYHPMRPDQTADAEKDLLNAAPCVLVMPVSSYAKYNELQYVDIRAQTKRPQEFGQTLTVQVLFSVYEDGVRMPGFIPAAKSGGGLDLSLIKEGTEEGLYLLLNWMDDFMEALLGVKIIPNTDMTVEEHTVTYSMYSDQKYISDRRPLFYGFVEVTFRCHADERPNPDFRKLLD